MATIVPFPYYRIIDVIADWQGSGGGDNETTTKVVSE